MTTVGSRGGTLVHLAFSFSSLFDRHPNR
jgi:hypothetical protein